MRTLRTPLVLAALVLLAACGSGSADLIAPDSRASLNDGTWTGADSGTTASADSTGTSRGLGQIGSGN
ncbi:MAG TPA: hypothetical protein VHG28_14955 [Longimicrobiaceae bacterium]|nr:hypothetical protein [Longimicrobiaceae bacterium]